MEKKWLLAMTLVLLVALVAACGPTAAPTEVQAPPTQKPAEATQAQPTQAQEEPTQAQEEPTQAPAAESEEPSGGTLVWANWSDPDILDPHATISSWVANQMYGLYDTLVWRGPNQDVYPGLAESWETSDDGKTYTFQLREGVTFHDGTPFNAEAVKYNFDRVKSGSAARVMGKAAASDLIGPFESAEVLDDLTVALHFSDPYPGFMDALSTHFLSMVSPAAVEKWGDDFGKNPVGTGPFMFKEWEPDHLTLVRNPDYNWAPPFMEHQGPAYLDEVIHRFVEEAGTRAAMLENGEIQLMSRPSVEDAMRLSEDPAYVAEKGYGKGLPHGYFPNASKYPTDDVRVRQALEYATNQELMTETLWQNLHKAATGPLASGTWGYNPAVENMYPYDPEKAKALLEEAGWTVGADGIRVDKDGNRLHLLVQSVPSPEMNAGYEFQQALYKDVGIEIEVVSMDSAATNDICTAGTPEICPLHFGFTDPSGLSIMFESKNAGTGFNWGQIKDPEIDRLLAEAQKTVDESKRKALYGDLQVFIMEQAYWVPMNEWALAHIHPTSVEGITASYKDPRFAYIYDARFVGQD
jgi:peptide/nickel transport system substrate-binding protein